MYFVGRHVHTVHDTLLLQVFCKISMVTGGYSEANFNQNSRNRPTKLAAMSNEPARRRSLLCAALCVAACAAAGGAADHVPSRVAMEHARWWDAPPAGWSRAGRADAAAVVVLGFGVVQRSWGAALDALLADVAHPGSAHYGAHYDDARIVATFCDAVSGGRGRALRVVAAAREGQTQAAVCARARAHGVGRCCRLTLWVGGGGCVCAQGAGLTVGLRVAQDAAAVVRAWLAGFPLLDLSSTLGDACVCPAL